MKKILAILIVLFIVFSCQYINAYACPHIDSYGTYTDDYDTQNDVLINIRKYQSFEYHVPQAYRVFPNYELEDVYKVIFSKYMFSRWYPASEFLGYKPINLNVDSVTMEYGFFNIVASVTEIYQKYKEFSSNIFYGISYDTVTEFINEEKNDLINLLTDNNLDFINSEFLKVYPLLSYKLYAYAGSPHYDYYLKYYPQPISLTFDMSDINLNNIDFNNLMAVNISDNNIYKLNGSYNENENTFTFTAAKRGIYTIINNPEGVLLDKELVEENYNIQLINNSIENLPQISDVADINDIFITLFAIRNEYNLLPDIQKESIINIEKLISAEKAYEEFTKPEEDKQKDNDKDITSCKSQLSGRLFFIIGLSILIFLFFKKINKVKI